MTVRVYVPPTDDQPDNCPRCGHVQANVNNPRYLAMLRADQILRHSCRNCGWSYLDHHRAAQEAAWALEDSTAGGDE